MTAASTPERTEELLHLLGDPAQVLAELSQVKQSADVLAADESRLINDYAEKWIALHAGRVIAEGDTLAELLGIVDATDPESRSHILVRFIDGGERALIL